MLLILSRKVKTACWNRKKKKKTRKIGVKLENRMMVNYTVDCQHSVGSVVQSGV